MGIMDWIVLGIVMIAGIAVSYWLIFDDDRPESKNTSKNLKYRPRTLSIVAAVEMLLVN